MKNTEVVEMSYELLKGISELRDAMDSIYKGAEFVTNFLEEVDKHIEDKQDPIKSTGSLLLKTFAEGALKKIFGEYSK